MYRTVRVSPGVKVKTFAIAEWVSNIEGLN